MIESGPLEFTITGSGDEYLDLSSAYLHLAASISVGGVTNPTEDDKVAPVNNCVQSIFSQVSLDGKMVSSSSNTYTYHTYIETLLTFGKAYKKTFLTNSMWYKDTAGYMNDLGDEHVGTTKQSNRTAHGKKVDMYFPIKRVDCKVLTIPAGSLSAFKEGIISGQLPK